MLQMGTPDEIFSKPSALEVARFVTLADQDEF
jgi:hypothetical protein